MLIGHKRTVLCKCVIIGVSDFKVNAEHSNNDEVSLNSKLMEEGLFEVNIRLAFNERWFMK